jgi:hypothetical protein
MASTCLTSVCPHRSPEALYELCEEQDGTVFVYQDADVLVRSSAGARHPGPPELQPVTSLVDAQRSPRCVLVFGEALTAAIVDRLAPAWQTRFAS